MNKARVQIDQHGRLLFPSKVRKECNIKSGDIFIMRVIDDEIRIISLDKAIKNAQTLFRKHVPTKENVVDDFLEYKKQEVALEERNFYKGAQKDG
jgi:AbrB family looped-hinge helix DNA binding protein